MASILFADVLGRTRELRGWPEEMEALREAAGFLLRKGHEIEVMEDPENGEERVFAMRPDILVADQPPFHLWNPMARADAEVVARPLLVHLWQVSAEAGYALASAALLDQVDAFVFRPYIGGLQWEEQRRYRLHLAFQEQLLATVGLLVHRMERAV